MKKLIVVIAAMLLSGCFYQSVTIPEVEMGAAICQIKEQLPPKQFTAHATGHETVTCYNNVNYEIDKGNLK